MQLCIHKVIREPYQARVQEHGRSEQDKIKQLTASDKYATMHKSEDMQSLVEFAQNAIEVGLFMSGELGVISQNQSR